MVELVRKVKVRTPTGRVSIRLRRKRPAAAKCANCGKLLHGVPRLRPSKMKKLAKSKKRPSRPYGGYLCGSCMRKLFKEKAKSKP